MSDIASIKPCILQRNTEHKHYKVIVAFADSTRVFLLDTRSRQVVVDNVRRIRLHVFNDSTTASRRVARRRRRRQEHTISSAAVAGEVGDGDGGSPSCHAVRPPDGPTRDHTRGHGKRREKERSGKVHAGPMRKERRRERKGRKSHAVGSPLSDGGKDFSLDTAEAGAGAGSWKGGTLAHSPPRGRSGDVETGHTAAAGFAPPVTTTAAAGAAVPPSPTQVP